MTDLPVLHGYYRSSASYRVRAVLNLKGMLYTDAIHHLRKGEQRAPEYLALNPQGLLPALEASGAVLTQSLAICEYLDEVQPSPALLPADPVERAHVRAFAYAFACDIHPVQNLKILSRLRGLGLEEEQVTGWAATVITEGLDACETLIADRAGPFCFGATVSLADVCLVPQIYNARRFGVDIRWPRLLEAERACLALEAFRAAAPESQPDNE